MIGLLIKLASGCGLKIADQGSGPIRSRHGFFGEDDVFFPDHRPSFRLGESGSYQISHLPHAGLGRISKCRLKGPCPLHGVKGPRSELTPMLTGQADVMADLVGLLASHDGDQSSPPKVVEDPADRP